MDIRNYSYKPQGICAKDIIINVNVEDKTVNSIDLIGGCHGNHLGIDALIKGMNIDEAADKLSGIKCGYKETSCPDQLSIALKKISEVINNENK